MARFELVYFTGCPLVERARQILRDRGVTAVTELNQDKLPSDHPYQKLTSPSILRDGKLLLGSRDGQGGRNCSIVDWAAASKLLAKA
jgi:hypothetical protein